MYNRSVLRFVPALMSLLLFGCAKNIETKEAVQEAVMKRLATVSGLNVAGMDVEVANLSFQGKQAEADVVFRAKGSAETMLKMKYKLEREGDQWVVKSSSGGMGGGAGSVAPSGLPPGHPPAAGQTP
jgi:hypothetical protein